MNINLFYVCFGNIVMLFFTLEIDKIFVLFLWVFTSIILRYIYNKGIDEINEFELVGIMYTSKERNELLEQYYKEHT